MVLFGGLEIVAAGYVYHKHKEHKKERERLEDEAEEERRRAERYRRRKRNHSEPPRERKSESKHYKKPHSSSQYYAPPPISDKKSSPPSYPIPHSYIPPTLQPHHSAEYFHSSPELYHQEAYTPPYQAPAPHIPTPPQQQQQSYQHIEYPSDVAELSAETHWRRNEYPSGILRQHSGEGRRSEDGPRVRFALPGTDNETQHDELHATTPPPPYVA
jgi:hypothetical protein